MNDRENPETPKSLNIALSKDQLIKGGVVAGILCLVAFSGIVNFNSCGKAKVNGKNICEYETELRENQDENEIHTSIEKIVKFGTKGQRATSVLIETYKNHDSPKIRSAVVNAIKTINKDSAGEALQILLFDNELELKQSEKHTLFREVLDISDPSEILGIFKQVVDGNLEEVVAYFNIVSSKDMEDKALKSKKEIKEAYFKAALETTFYVLELKPEEGELNPPQELIELQEQLFSGIAITTLPFFKDQYENFKKKADNESKEKMKHILENLPDYESRIGNLVEKYKDSTLTTANAKIILIAMLITSDPIEGLERLSNDFEEITKLKDFNTQIYVPVIASLQPTWCLDELDKEISVQTITGNIIEQKGSPGPWSKEVTEKLYEISHSHPSEGLKTLASRLIVNAVKCSLPEADKAFSKMLDEYLESKNKFMEDLPPALVVSSLTKEKKITPQTAFKYFTKLSNSDNYGLKYRADDELEELISKGIISPDTAREEKLNVYSSLSKDGRVQTINEIIAKGLKSKEDKAKTRDAILSLGKSEPDPSLRSHAYEQLLLKVAGENAELAIPVWANALTDEALKESFTDKLVKSIIPSYPYGSRVSGDPKPLVPFLLKLQEQHGNEKIQNVLKILIGAGYVGAENSLKIVKDTLENMNQDDPYNTLNWATSVLDKIQDKGLVISFLEGQMNSESSNSTVKGYARLAIDRIDHTKSRIDISNGNLKLGLRPRVGKYDLSKLIETVSKANKPGLGFITTKNAYVDRLRYADKAASSEIIVLNQAGKVMEIHSLPSVSEGRQVKSIYFDNAATFLVIVPKGTSAAQNITLETEIPFNTEALLKMDALQDNFRFS